MSFCKPRFQALIKITFHKNDARVRYLSMKLVRFTFLFSCRE